MEKNNLSAQMKKGVIEICILAILKKRECYPSEILITFKENDILIPEGTLYPILTRLKNAEYLSYKWVESTEGPPRKYFSITPKGLSFYKQLLKNWTELKHGVDGIISLKN